MKNLFIQEVGPSREMGKEPPFFSLNYPVIKSHQIPRVGEYIRLREQLLPHRQKDVPKGWFIVRQVGYTYSCYKSELDFDVTLFVEATKGGFLPRVKVAED